MGTFASQKTGFVAIIILIARLDLNAVILLFFVVITLIFVAVILVATRMNCVVMAAVIRIMVSVVVKVTVPLANIAAPGIFAVLMTMTAAVIIVVPRGTNVAGRPAVSLHRPAVVTTAAQPASTVAIPLQGVVTIRILQAAIHATAKSAAAIAYPGIINVVLVEAGGVLLTKNAVPKASGVVL